MAHKWKIDLHIHFLIPDDDRVFYGQLDHNNIIKPEGSSLRFQEIESPFSSELRTISPLSYSLSILIVGRNSKPMMWRFIDPTLQSCNPCWLVAFLFQEKIRCNTLKIQKNGHSRINAFLLIPRQVQDYHCVSVRCCNYLFSIICCAECGKVDDGQFNLIFSLLNQSMRISVHSWLDGLLVVCTVEYKWLITAPGTHRLAALSQHSLINMLKTDSSPVQQHHHVGGPKSNEPINLTMTTGM